MKILSGGKYMGCGCGKKGSTPRRQNLRPTIGPRSIQGGTAAGPNPTEIRALGMQSATSLGESRRMDDQRLKIEKIRREAIKKRLNK
jgi:hypothetical protein